MKIALFSDVHANLPALEAMFDDLDKREVDSIYCLGDLIGYHVWPNEVIDLIRSRRIPVISGNHDAKLVNLKDLEIAINGDNNYAYRIVNDRNGQYLRDLPAHIRIEYKSSFDSIDILMVHGSPRKNNEYVLADTDEKYVLNMLEESGSSVLFVAHSHIPYHRTVRKEDGKYAHIINTGSVGKPKDGNPQGGYVIVEFTHETKLMDPSTIKVNFIRFNYNLTASIEAILESPLPNELADRLLKAY
ncbi:metallophosphoesterase family protein [Sphingobacterium hotanense]|uniref:Metallophosphoesterase family protein n=1 Tax=Sphingobacterium hotanense TaxID=649196 RepID=A0ABT7NKB4_9SPHI|nr:metallophosphoesterase family protein [Sphingobacterium hotanense]MDM1047673.1 metallophosphoesterase family protein [Sphingobacterium hotanense]